MTHRARRTVIALLLVLIAYVVCNSLAHTFFPEAFVWAAEDREEAKWLASSRSWWDRKACRFLAVCGLNHYIAHFWGQDHTGGGTGPSISQDRAGAVHQTRSGRRGQWTFGGGGADVDADGGAGFGDQIPPYVLEYAPLVWLHSKELFWLVSTLFSPSPLFSLR